MLLFIILLCLPFLISLTVWYNISSKSLERNVKSFNGELVEQVIERVDTYFEDIERLTLPLLTNPTVQQFLRLQEDQYYERIGISDHIESQVFSTITFGRNEISNVSIYNKQGFAVTTRNSFIYIYKEVFKDYLESAQLGDNFQIRGVRQDHNQSVIAITRYLTNTSSYQQSGIFVMDLKLDSLSEIAQHITPGISGFIWIMDQNGVVVYHPDQERWGQKVDDSYIDVLLSGSADSIHHHIDEKGQLLTYRQSDYSKLTVISQVPVNELIGELTVPRKINITSTLGIIIVALLGVGAYSMFLTRSLLILKKLMKRVEDGDLNVHAPAVNTKEMASLYKSFNHMVQEIARLIQVVHRSEIKEKQMQIKQRESALQSMQSQINPHFLYNTLEVINSYAIVEGVLPISRMATALADVFRYSVGHSGQLVTMKDEIDHIRTYLQIQQQRYKDLEIDIQVQSNETLVRLKALRLILQPIIENAFIHGYEKQKRKATYIGIHDEIRNGVYILYIKDHGGGMDEEVRNRYNEIFSKMEILDESDLDEITKDKLSRIGLRNVHYRILLTFGDDYGLSILEPSVMGTTIGIRLPAHADTILREQNGGV